MSSRGGLGDFDLERVKVERKPWCSLPEVLSSVGDVVVGDLVLVIGRAIVWVAVAVAEAAEVSVAFGDPVLNDRALVSSLDGAVLAGVALLELILPVPVRMEDGVVVDIQQWSSVRILGAGKRRLKQVTRSIGGLGPSFILLPSALDERLLDACLKGLPRGYKRLGLCGKKRTAQYDAATKLERR